MLQTSFELLKLLFEMNEDSLINQSVHGLADFSIVVMYPHLQMLLPKCRD